MSFTFTKRFGALPDGAAPALEGPEDLALDATDPGAPALLVSCQKRRHPFGENGFIGRVRLGPGGPETVTRLPMGSWPGGGAFHPLGLSFLPSERTLFVVNKALEDDQRIEVFRVGPDALEHLKTLGSADFVKDPNDLVGLPGGRLFVTNAHRKTSLLGNLLPDLFKAKNGSVAHFDGSQWSLVADKLAFANGIAVDEAGDVYVTSSRDGMLRVFSRVGQAWQVTAWLEIGGLPDNLTWIDDRYLLVATHESAGAFAWHGLTNGKARSGGSVYRIDAKARPLSKEVLFENDGKGISGVSSAVLWQERLYLGQVLANGIGVATRA